MMATQTVLIGSYTQPVAHAPHAAGPGILKITLCGTKITSIDTTPPSVCGVNPSYLAQIGTHVYAANEVSAGTISHLRLTDTGLALITRYECGSDPCHVAVVPGGLLAACFGDGSIWSYTSQDGVLKMADRWVCNSAQGVHQALPIGNGRIIVCAPVEGALYELFRCDDGQLREKKRVTMEGYPRHCVVSMQSVYVALAKERMVVEMDTGRLSVVTRVRLGDGNGVLGAIRMANGEILVSERGERNNRIWCLDKQILKWCCESGGAVPRDFAVSDGILVVSHQDGCVGIGTMESVGEDGVERVEIVDENGALVCVLFVDL